MIWLVIAILVAAVVFLTAKLILLKKEMKKTTARLSKWDDRALPVNGVDRDLEDMIVEINKLYDKTLEIRNNATREEKALRDSISMVSHDMKTPLTSVIGYLQLASKSEGEEVSKNIDIALERAIYLNTLVNDFFDLSVVESAKYVQTPERINICELICEEVFALAPAFDKRGIEPSFANSDEDIRLITDRKMVTRIIQNLLSNCAKYASDKISISVRKETGCVYVSIVSGIKGKVDTERMFERFYREDEARTGEGAGLGMYICRKFTETLGGSIGASQSGSELTVTFELPEGNL